MTSFRSMLTPVLLEFSDPEMHLVNEAFLISLCEAAQFLTLLRSKAFVESVNFIVPFQSFVPGLPYLPVVNLNSLISNLGRPISVRFDSTKVDLVKTSFSPLFAFSDLWSLIGNVKSWYMLGVNLLGIRKLPEEEQVLTLFYLPYVEVTTLEQDISLRDEYIKHLQSFIRAFLAARLSRFELATTELKAWTEGTINVNQRTVRA